jgi:hypothetical protein
MHVCLVPLAARFRLVIRMITVRGHWLDFSGPIIFDGEGGMR